MGLAAVGENRRVFVRSEGREHARFIVAIGQGDVAGPVCSRVSQAALHTAFASRADRHARSNGMIALRRAVYACRHAGVGLEFRSPNTR